MDKGGCGCSAVLPITTALAFLGQGLSRHRSDDHLIDVIAGQNAAVCTENLIRVDDVMESPKLAE
jgi:hypothetical protein